MLATDCSGLALLEFALSLPIVLGLGAYGLELSNLALLNLRISQIALNLADNASRVGSYDVTAGQQLREVDINDVLQAARYQGASINLTTNGRITLSSLENVQQAGDSSQLKRIHWQRCIGKKSGANYDSTYGVAATVKDATYLPGAIYDKNAGVDTDGSNTDNSGNYPGSLAPNGMGEPGQQVSAPLDSGVMFVEINYLTTPLFGTWLSPPARIHYAASFIVRDKRDFKEIYNVVTSPATTRATCDLHNT